MLPTRYAAPNTRPTKTKRSRRTLALPARCVAALAAHQQLRHAERDSAPRWADPGLASRVGTQLNSHNVRRGFRALAKIDGMTPADWTPRELRHSFVPLLSESGLPIEEIRGSSAQQHGRHRTGFYRHQIRPVVQAGAVAMDGLFGTS
jgi:hypothetical protein